MFRCRVQSTLMALSNWAMASAKRHGAILENRPGDDLVSPGCNYVTGKPHWGVNLKTMPQPL